MTEVEWNASTRLFAMAEFARETASRRKSILFVCAMCRFHWNLLYHDSSKRYVEAVEKKLEGEATVDPDASQYAAECPTFGFDFEPRILRRWAKGGKVSEFVQNLARMGVLSKEEPFIEPQVRERLHAAACLAYDAECVDLGHQGVLRTLETLQGPAIPVLRCILGPLPFRRVAVDPAWLAPSVVALAKAMYYDRAFDRMPILGDALEEAGCTNGDAVAHCRGPGPHVRGCWLIDLLLGRE